ncbi:Pycsar system effector family protein [Streptomyces avermitilis]|uniref:Pycsar system effector family protein n=1 Tax=Streptomyces avermitilis TaxID=33903 RepID=UPI0036885755
MFARAQNQLLEQGRYYDAWGSWRDIGANGLPGELTWEEFVASSSRARHLQNIAGTRPLQLLTWSGETWLLPRAYVDLQDSWERRQDALRPAATSYARRELRGRKVKAEAASNFIYFGHLMHRQADELTTALKNTDILPVLSRQLIVMSKIAWAKHRHAQTSFISFGVGAALVFFAGLTRLGRRGTVLSSVT